MEERRQHERFPVILGSEIDSEQSEARFGLTQDVSRGGALLLALIPFDEGKQLSLQIILSDDNVTRTGANVLRCVELTERGMWQYELAVEFDDLLDESVVEILRKLADA